MRRIIKKATRISRARLYTQLGVLAFLNIPLLRLHSVCAPVLHCHGCPLSVMACPIGVLVNFSTFRIFPFVTIGILGVVGTISGRFACGWLCPFGLLQDMLYRIKTRKIALPRALNGIKYALLIGLVFVVPFFLPGSPYTFCDFCPAGTLESTVPWAFMGVVGRDIMGFSLRIAVLAGMLLLAIMASRSWCRVLCPLGAIFGLFNRFSLFRFDLSGKPCNDCGACSRTCSVEINPVADMNSPDCIRCMDCTSTGHMKFGTK